MKRISVGKVARGRLIVFEGTDESGKTTLSKALVKQLKAAGLPCRWFSFPGQEPGTLGKLVHNIHHGKGHARVSSISPVSLQLLHIAAHIDAIQSKIGPALERGENVVLDRFWWSTLVYGTVMGVDLRALRSMIEIEKLFWKKITPSILFLIERDQSNGDKTNSLQKSLMKEYRKLARRESQKHPVVTISNRDTISKALSKIRDYVDKFEFASRQKKSLALSTKLSSAEFGKPELLCRKFNSLKPTTVYDTYWRFAAKRQAIFFRRVRGESYPWTDDPVLTEFKFTNAYRASDRVSQYLIKHVVYSGDQSPREVFFRTILFKIFNRIETWELLRQEFGELSYSEWSFERFDALLTKAMTQGKRIYSAAYIMPTGKNPLDQGRKHRMHLRLIGKMMDDDLPTRLADSKSMKEAFEMIRTYPTIGDFLAYQYIIDLNYGPLLNFDEMDFVMPGPGALNGIKKCFADFGGLSESDIIREVTERQYEEFERVGLKFESLWGRPLQLIDCQNLFCEVDKYSRVVHPDVSGVTNRTRIKQKYRPHAEPITYWYPPKWELNERIKDGVHNVSEF